MMRTDICVHVHSKKLLFNNQTNGMEPTFCLETSSQKFSPVLNFLGVWFGTQQRDHSYEIKSEPFHSL